MFSVNALSSSIFFFLQAHHEAASRSLWETIVQSNALNFAIALGVILWIVSKFKLHKALDVRQNNIIEELKLAEAQKAKALEDLKAIEQRTAHLTTEVETIIKEAQSTAEMIAKTIVSDAEAEASKVMENARKRVQLEEKTAARELERRLMHEAIYSAKQLLENTLSHDDKQRSVQDFVESLPELYKKEAYR